MRLILMFFFVLASSASLFSQNQQETQTLSLQQAIDHALKLNSQVISSLYDEQIALNKAHEIRGIGLPQVNASLDVRDFLKIPTSLIPAEFFGGTPGTFIPVQFGTRYAATAGIDASQIIFDGGYLVGLQASKVYLELSKKASQRTRIETHITVSKAYFNALINKERLTLLDAHLARLSKLKDDTKALNEAGFVEKLDLDRIEINYNNLLIEKDKVHRLVELSFALLKYQIGMDQKTQLSLSDKLEENTIITIPEVEAKQDHGKRIEISLLETQRKLTGLQLKRERFGYLPNLIAYGSYSQTAQRNEFDIFEPNKTWFPTAIIGARLGVPIFDGLQKHYRIQQTQLALLKLDNDKRFLEQSMDLEFNNSVISLQNSTSSLRAQKANIQLAEEVYRVSKIKYEQGLGNNLEVLTSETALKEAQTNYLNALYETIIAQIDYKKAIGEIK